MRLALGHAGFALQARALFSQALLDDVFDAGIDLDQTGGMVRASVQTAECSSESTGKVVLLLCHWKFGTAGF
jgi:hypothetical protein